MKAETIELYQRLRAALQQELGDIERERDDRKERIAAIEVAIQGSAATASSPRGRKKGASSPSAGSAAHRGPRADNQMSLKEAIIKVTTDHPLTKEQVLEEVQRIGYKFSTDKPANSVNQALYGDKPGFKNEGGKFSPILDERPSAGPPALAAPGERAERPSVEAAELPGPDIATKGRRAAKTSSATDGPTEIQEK